MAHALFDWSIYHSRFWLFWLPVHILRSSSCRELNLTVFVKATTKHSSVSLLHSSLTQSWHYLQRVNNFDDFLTLRCGLILKELFGSFQLVNLLCQVHMVLNHPLGVLIGERIFTKLDHLHIVEAGLWRWYESRTTFGHCLVYSLLDTVLQYYVVDLLFKAVFKVFDL